MQMQMETEKGNDRKESITSQVTTMRTEACALLSWILGKHTVCCVGCPPPQVSFNKDEEQCASCPQCGAQEEDGLRGHTGEPGRTVTKIQMSIHSLPRVEVLKAG